MDQSLFEFFHFTLANDFFDWLLPYWRKRETWIPLYVLLAAYMLWRDWRRGLATLLAVIVAVALADFITSGLLKPWVGRIRPCATPELAGQLRELVSCGGSLSFPSSHASNHLAIALVLGWSGVLSPPNLPEGEGLISPPPSGELEGDKSSGELEGDKSSGELEGDKSSGELEGDKSSGRLGGDIPGFLLVIWAVTISLAQIYMAKHWPTDILGGWLVGAIAAWVILLIYKRWILPKLD